MSWKRLFAHFGKLKPGLILLFSASAAFLALTNPFGDPYYDGEERLITTFCLAGIVLLSISLSVILGKAEKRIQINTFSYGWLVRSNFLISLLCYIALVLFSVALVFIRRFPGEWILLVVAVAGYGIWAVPIATTMLNLLPALFIMRFRENKIITKSAGLILIMSSLGMIFFTAARNATCDFTRNHACVAKRAIEARNPELCEKIEDGYTRALCYENVSQKIGDITLCAKISNLQIQSVCIANVAIALKDPSLCEMVRSTEMGTDKESCYAKVRIGTQLFRARPSGKEN